MKRSSHNRTLATHRQAQAAEIVGDNLAAEFLSLTKMEESR